MPQVICFGEALVDRLGPPGGDPARDRPVEDRLGGAPANGACALARLGTPSALVGRLGADPYGDAFADLLRRRPVDISALQRDGRRPTRVVLVRRERSGEREFGGFAGDLGEGFADQAIDAAALEAPLVALLAEARWLSIGTLPLASSASAGALERAVALAGDRGVPLALDVNWRPTFWSLSPEAARQSILPLLERARLIKLSAEEADWLFGALGEERRDPAAIAASLGGRPAVVITDGENPVRWWLGGAAGTATPWPVEVVDTTGAGDAFLAGLLHRLCAEPQLISGTDPDRVRRAMEFASACGALVCQGAGAIDPQPSEPEVCAFLARRSGLNRP